MQRTLTQVLSLRTSVAAKVLAVAFWVALTALSANAKIFLPFTPVPITLQTGVVVLGGLVLGFYGVLAQLVYVLLGGIGLPLFAVTLPGVAPLWGPTGGYLVGFVFASYLSAVFVRRNFASLNFGQKFSRLLLISMAIFVPGVLFLSLSMGVSLEKALALGFYPFILGDLVKTAIVSLVPASLTNKL